MATLTEGLVPVCSVVIAGSDEHLRRDGALYKLLSDYDHLRKYKLIRRLGLFEPIYYLTTSKLYIDKFAMDYSNRYYGVISKEDAMKLMLKRGIVFVEQVKNDLSESTLNLIMSSAKGKKL